MTRRQSYVAAETQPVRHRAEPRVVVNWAATATAVVAFGLGLAVGVVITATLLSRVMMDADSSLNMGPQGLPPCVTEDSVGCYWDAQTMGNRLGSDVVAP